MTAFIKWGFTGALSSVSGLAGELNKTVWDAGAALEKIFVSQRMEPAFPALCRRGRLGNRVAGGPSSLLLPGQRSPDVGTLYNADRKWEGGWVPWRTGPWVPPGGGGVWNLGSNPATTVHLGSSEECQVPGQRLAPSSLPPTFLRLSLSSSAGLLALPLPFCFFSWPLQHHQRPFAKYCESRHG